MPLGMDNFDYLYALTDFYLKRGKFKKARYYAEQILIKYHNRQMEYDLLNFI